MKGGILEVFLVSAEGIRHTNLIGKPAYYVVIECGTQVRRSKVSAGFILAKFFIRRLYLGLNYLSILVTGLNGADNHEEVCWNEKYTFEVPFSELKNLTHLKFRILDKEYLSDGGFVGETIVYLEGIIMEGNDKGFIELRPAPYNVVLEDDTYKGQIKIGLKFMSNVSILYI
ncbi:hypothetical protein RJ639_010604 [Escallonia herrerae]|uniref:C2 domain-containing protein n=1 Tax=Escallonia herrerae TaxID=1293975 RepID=A0AA88VP97_9ASTE|nr:hypothetical protein RJ639_010604 [Escallonia herrerae]